MYRIIDPHLHFFNLSRGDYHWLKTDNPPFWPDKAIIQRDFSEQDVSLEAPFQLCGLVHIEAGFDNDDPCRELQWLAASVNTCPHKAIAFIDLTLPSEAFERQLAALLGCDQSCGDQLVGIRHITEGKDAELLLAPPVLDNLACLSGHRLIFEAQFELANAHISEQLARYAKALPALNIVVNHGGLVCRQRYKPWLAGLEALSPCTNIAIKCSGWELAERDYQPDWMAQVIKRLLRCCGDDRVMLASNFPLCLFSSNYQDLWQRYSDLPLTPTQWHKLSYANAKRLYQL